MLLLAMVGCCVTGYVLMVLYIRFSIPPPEATNIDVRYIMGKDSFSYIRFDLPPEYLEPFKNDICTGEPYTVSTLPLETLLTCDGIPSYPGGSPDWWTPCEAEIYEAGTCTGNWLYDILIDKKYSEQYTVFVIAASQ